MRVYFKVVRDDLTSLVIGTHSLKYKLNEWTSAPPPSYLFIFDDLPEAELLEKYPEGCITYPCLADGVVEPLLFVPRREEDYKKFWELVQNKTAEDKIQEALKEKLLYVPEGTLWAKRVKLLPKEE